MIHGKKAANRETETLFLVDGEHQPATVLDAVGELSKRRNYKPVGLYFLGGREKLSDFSQLAMDHVELVVPGDPLKEFTSVLRRLRPELVLDMSDLPVMGPSQRMRMAALALSEGVVYSGSDFEFRPPRFEKVLDKPSCAVIGTGKRCGKTAVSAEMAAYLAGAGKRPVIVAMGRGGPPQPYLLQGMEITGDFLLSETKKGLHAASDHYEDALVASVTTVGSRRCGGGMAGETLVTNCVEAAALANGLDVDAVIMEGSGSSLPPVFTNTRLCVISAAQDFDEALGYVGSYRILISDGVIITMAEKPFASPDKLLQWERRIGEIYGKIGIVKTIFRPHPLKSIRGKTVFLVCTAPEAAGDLIEEYLREAEGCRVVGRSHSLSDREKLERELQTAGKPEVFLTELKAAAVDVVTRNAYEMGIEVTYFHNKVVPVEGKDELDRLFTRIWDLTLERSCRETK